MFEIFKDAKAFDRSLDSWDVTGVLNHFNASHIVKERIDRIE